MNEKGYNIPIGVDLGQSIKGLDDLIGIVEQATKGASDVQQGMKDVNNAIAEGATKSTDALKKQGTEIIENKKKLDILNKTIEDTFDSKSAQEFEKRTKSIDTELKRIKEEAKAAGKAIREGIASNAGQAEMEARVSKLRALIETLNNSNSELGFTVDDSAFAEFQTKLAAAGSDIEQLGQVVDFAKEKLSGLVPDSDEFNALSAQVNLAEGFLEGLGTTVDEVTNSSITLKAELRRVKEELAQLEISGQGGTEQFEQLSQRAGELEDQIGDVSARVRVLASDTKYLDAGIEAVQGLVAGFTAAQGAIALFGAENEDVEKVIQRVTGAMAVLQGIQAIAEVMNKDSALSVLFLSSARRQDAASAAIQTAATTGQTVATEGATVATKGLSLAMKALGIGLVISLIAYLVANWDKLKASVTNLFPALKDTEGMFNKVQKVLFGTGQVVIGVGKAIFNYLITPVQVLIKLFQGDWDGAVQSFKNGMAEIADGLNVSANYQQGVANAVAHQAEVKRKENLENLIKSNEKLLEIQKAAGKNTIALERKILQDKAELAKGDKEASEEIAQERAVFEAGAAKLAAEARKKAKEDAEKAAKEAAEKASERNKQIVSLTRETSDLTISAMKEGIAKEKALLSEEYRRKIEDAGALIALSADAEKKKQDLIIALRGDQALKEAAIDLKYAAEAVARQQTINEIIVDAMKAGQDKEIKQAELGLEAKLISLKKDGLLTVETEKALRDQLALTKTEITRRYNLEELDNQKAISLARIDAMEANGKSEVAFEKIKESLRTQVLLDAANDRLKVLKEVGGKENEVAIAELESTIKGYRNILSKTKKEDKTNLFEFLGIDEAKTKEFAEALSTAGQIASDVFSGIAEGIQRQIDAKQNQIDAYTDQIDQLESELDRERDLQEKGLANNVALKEQEITAAALQKQKLVKQQEDLQKKQQAMQKAQIIADGLAQTSNLITASSDIFKAFAKIPFLGVPLAIAAIGAMFGGFAFAKINAFKAVGSSNSGNKSYGDGGEFILEGPSHSSGGLGVYNEKTGQRVAEVEGGEGFFAINRKSTRKHKGLLKAINDDDFSRYTAFSASLDQMLAESGIQFPHEDMDRTVIIAQQANSKESDYKTAMISMAENSESLKKIAETNEKMLELEQERPTVIDTGDMVTIKTGNRTRIIRKK